MIRNDSSHCPNHRQPWLLSEIRYVEAHYGKTPTSKIAEHLGRTATAVRMCANKLGCSKAASILWSEAEKDIIRTHYANGEGITRVMQLLPGRTRKTIFMMAHTIGVVSARNWSAQECKILKKYYPLLGTATVDKLVGRTIDAVKIKANDMGLRFFGCSGPGKQRMWQPEELKKLEKHLHLPLTELAAYFPDRTLISVKKAKQRLVNKRKRGIQPTSKGKG